MYNSNCVIFLPDLNKAKDAFVTFMRGPKSVHPEDRKVLIFINIAIICVTSVKVFWGIYFQLIYIKILAQKEKLENVI